MRPHRIVEQRSSQRSRISNGRVLPANIIDGRSAEYRRFKDLISGHASDLGFRFEDLTESQRALIRRIATLQIELERMDVTFVEQGGAEPRKLGRYISATNTLNRLCAALGTLNGPVRKPAGSEDLQSYLRVKRNGKRRNGHRVRLEDHDDYEEDGDE